MIVVITVPTDPQLLADRFLPPATHIITQGSMAYRVYDVDDAGSDREYRDPVDGTLLLRYSTFPDQDAAMAWIRSEAVP